VIKAKFEIYEWQSVTVSGVLSKRVTVNDVSLSKRVTVSDFFVNTPLSVKSFVVDRQ
jgi:hypothetical protein